MKIVFCVVYLAGVCSALSVNVSVGAGAGAPEGAEKAGGKRQVASGVCAARQRFPPVAAGDQVEDMFFQLSLCKPWLMFLQSDTDVSSSFI